MKGLALLLLGVCAACGSAQAGKPPAQNAARALQDSFVAVARGVSASVVALRVEARRVPQDPFDGFPFGPPNPRVQRGMGSGLVLRSDGHVLTNGHVVRDATQVEVVFKDGRRLPGKIVGVDAATDLAVVKVDAQGLRAAVLADSSHVQPGQWVVAIGSPFGLDYTVTVGVVSAVGRGGVGMNEIEDYLQTDASINPGNSGGPLVNLDGEVIGINTMIVGGGTGIGFAIPSSLARNVADQLIATGSVSRSYIGVAFQEITSELAEVLGVPLRGGALVSAVQDGGPAQLAGLRPGDVIVTIDGQPIAESRDLLRVVLLKPIGATVQLGVLRDKQSLTLPVVTVERPSDVRARKGKGKT
jgi:serine protease Do